MIIKDKQAKTELYHKYSRASDTPLLVLALLMIPLIIVPEVITLAPDQDNFIEMADWFIYGLFAIDFVIKIYLAPSVIRHVKENWIDVLVLALPLLRPLRILRGARVLRLLRAARLLVFAAQALRKLRGILTGRGLHVVSLVILTIVILSALLVSIFERGAGGTIKEFPDALWWAMSTVTTVGYGDAIPVTPEGRGIAVFLMVIGICFFSILTANIAAYFVETKEDDTKAELEDKLAQVLDRLNSIEAHLSQQVQEKERTPPEQILRS